MYKCLFDVRTGSGCPNERTLDFEYCNSHLQTPRGRQHVMDTIQSRNLTVPSDVERLVESAKALPDADYQTTALERMVEALDRVLEWESDAKRSLDGIPQEDWRFTDRSGAEQSRTELAVYERALDRTTRTLKDVSKMALQDKMISLGKAQVELMVRILMAVVTDMELSPNETDKARAILLAKFQDEARLDAKVEAKITQDLQPALPVANGGFMTDPRAGGVTGVSIQGQKVI